MKLSNLLSVQHTDSLHFKRLFRQASTQAEGGKNAYVFLQITEPFLVRATQHWSLYLSVHLNSPLVMLAGYPRDTI